MSTAREQTEKAADRIRGELMSTLQEIERRRHLATDLRYQAEKHFTLLVGIGLGTVVAVGAGVAFAVVRARRRRANLHKDRLAGLVRAWQNPRRIATAEPRGPMPEEIVRKVALTLAAVLASQLAKQGAERFFPKRH